MAVVGTGIPPDLKASIEGLLESQGLEVVDITLGPREAGRTLRVLVDREGGLGTLDCEKAARAMGPILDASPEPGGRYLLEVSSAGLERPLVKPADYERFKGRAAKMKFKRDEVTATLEGTLEGLENGLVLLRTEKTLERIPLEGVLKAKLVFHYGGR